MKFTLLIALVVFLTSNLALAQPGPDFYRAFTAKVRQTGSFKVPVPGTASFNFSYSLQPDAPLTPAFSLPLVSDLPSIPPQPQGLYRRFWDKMLVKDGSFIQLGEDKVPITCIYISGQDNRFIGDRGTLFPEFLIRVYLVANDFTCTGPLNPGWPTNGGRRELWDTYIYYEVRDPTIMLPTEIRLRYRWAEYPGVLIDPGTNPSPTPSPTPGGGT